MQFSYRAFLDLLSLSNTLHQDISNIDLGRVIPTFSVLSTAIVPFIPVFYIALPSIKDIDDSSFNRSFVHSLFPLVHHLGELVV